MKLVTEYPFWFLLFCLATGAAFSLLLYYKDKNSEFDKPLRYWLMGLRFLSVSLISFLLLSPLLKTSIKTVEKPVVILAQDNSKSILLNKDSAFYRNQYPELFAELEKELGKSFEVRTYNFGEKLEEQSGLTFAGRQTDMSGFMEEVMTRYSGRNVGALIIASDGLYNKGSNPLYTGEKFKFPVYTIAMGDTNAQKDLLIAKVNFNRVVYLGNKFPIEIYLQAGKLKGNSATVTVTKGNQTVYTQQVNISSERFQQTLMLQLEAKEGGMQRYHIQVTELPGEITTSNNSRDVFIDVLESREKILILGAAPHPDIAAIKSALESNFNYEVSVFHVQDFIDNVAKYNLIILHQLPSADFPANVIIQKANDAGIPLLFVTGSKTNINALNALHVGVSIATDKLGSTESQAFFKKDFALFTLSEETRKLVNDFPPLNCAFGVYRTQPSANVVLTQSINGVETDRPMMLFNQELSKKTGLIAGEGIWRWKLANFAATNNHDAFNELIVKSIQYLSVRVDKNFFRIGYSHNYLENEPVTFTAEVYNQTYELINEPEVEMLITNTDNKSFPYSFSRSGNAYQLNAGTFATGDYKFTAKVKVGEKVFQQKGEFSVTAQNLESLNTLADHNLMFSLAQKHDGKMLYPATMKTLPELLKQRGDIKSISFIQKRFNDLVNLAWVLILIVVLVGTEMFLRKRAGSY